MLKRCLKAFLKNIKTEYFRKTYKEHENISLEDAFLELHSKLRPGEPATVKAGQQLLYSRFFDPKRYDLGRVGRYKINKKLNLKEQPKDLEADLDYFFLK